MPSFLNVPGRRPTDRSQANGAVSGSQTASSFIASQIAPKVGTEQPRIDSNTLSLLLEESLRLDEHGSSLLSSMVSENHLLICAVVQAGLDTIDLQDDSPVGQINHSTEQICQCIRVIQAVVGKTPSVLLVPAESPDYETRPGDPPLFLWLIPKLLSLLVTDKNESMLISKNVWSLLLDIVCAEQACLSQFNLCDSIVGFLEMLVDTLLSRLEEFDASRSLPSSLTLTISTSSSSLPATASAPDQFRDATRRNPVTVGKLPQAFEMALKLLDMVTESNFRTPSLIDFAVRCRATSILDQYNRLWILLTNFLDSSIKQDHEASSIVLSIFDGLGKVIRKMSTAGSNGSTQQIAFAMWAKWVAKMFQLCQNDSLDIAAETYISVLDATLKVTSWAAGLALMVGEVLSAVENSIIVGSTVTPAVKTKNFDTLAQISRMAAVGQNMAQNTSDPKFPFETDGRTELEAEASRPRKKRRLSARVTPAKAVFVLDELQRKLSLILVKEECTDIQDLKKAASNYGSLIERQQCDVYQILGNICCKGRRAGEAPGDVNASTEDLSCCICDPNSSSVLASEDTNRTRNDYLTLFLTLAKQPHRSSKVGAVAMTAFQRLLAHNSSPNGLDVSLSSAGKFCLDSLRSSSRELRVSATSCLKQFIVHRPGLDLELAHKNCVEILTFLNDMWVENVPSLQETIILALSDVGLVGGENELKSVLERFVEYLGHPNPYITGIVYGELQKLARNMNVTAAALIRPFWRTIAAVVINNLQGRPVIAQTLCDFLGTGMSVDGLLAFTEEYTLPHLVLTGRKEVVQRIALTYGSTTTAIDLCTKSNNFAGIISFLLARLGQHPEWEEEIMSLLLEASPDFAKRDLAGWIKLEPILIACDLMKIIADADSDSRPPAYHGLKQLARLDTRRGTNLSSSKGRDVLATFLETHALGIVTQITTTLNDGYVRSPVLEKRKCLGAIGELLKLGKNRISHAVPQICGCLRSALEQDDLTDKAFESWATLVENLDISKFDDLQNETLAIVVRYWTKFRESTRTKAQESINEIWQSLGEARDEALQQMPSLSGIRLLEDFESAMIKSKQKLDPRQQLVALSQRLTSKSGILVEQALAEWLDMLSKNQAWFHQALLRGQPDPVVADLTRSILDCCVTFGSNKAIAIACGKALGKIGCLDPNQIERSREKRSVLVMTNFNRADETEHFLMFFLEEILIKCFLTAPNPRIQGFLAWGMQSLLQLCGLPEIGHHRLRNTTKNSRYRTWDDLDKSTQAILTPFRSSRYTVKNIAATQTRCSYPIFAANDTTHRDWLGKLVFDLLDEAPGDNSRLIFEICARLIRDQDLSIPIFLLPFAALNLMVSEKNDHKQRQANLVNELRFVLEQPLTGSRKERENLKLCSQRVFDVLDYISNWLQQRRSHYQAAMAKTDGSIEKSAIDKTRDQIKMLEVVPSKLSPALISKRAIECGEYSRALFHWEQHIKQIAARRKAFREAAEKNADKTSGKTFDKTPFEFSDKSSDESLARLQMIYAQIDEPDGIEGISAQMHTLNIDQQILEHEKAGDWEATQSWYEIKLQSDPLDSTIQTKLLNCLKEAGQTEALLNRFDSLDKTASFASVVPFAAEAAWTSSNWDKLQDILRVAAPKHNDFNTGIGEILQALRQDNQTRAGDLITEIRLSNASSLTLASAASFQSCHDFLFRLHVLEDLEMIIGSSPDTKSVVNSLDQRLKVIGSDVSIKHYLLNLRRATMTLSSKFSSDVGSSWLAIANLTRKSSLSNQAYNAILHATNLKEAAVAIEHPKLMWNNGHHRKAIHALEGAIKSGTFESGAFQFSDRGAESYPLTDAQRKEQQNILKAKACLLLAKWSDSAGQTRLKIIRDQYQKSAHLYYKWDKGWFYLGKYYNKILDFEKVSTGKQSQEYLTGETSKLVIENYLRGLRYGSKYVFQSLPKVLTLWLELAASPTQPHDPKRGDNELFAAHLREKRKSVIASANEIMKKSLNRLHPVMFYTIFPQIVARIGNKGVGDILVSMAIKVLRSFPHQAIWTILALEKSSNKQRSSRGTSILNKAVELERADNQAAYTELRMVVSQGRKMSEELLRIADHDLKDTRTAQISLFRDLKFNQRLAPCRLVVPTESCLIPSMPTSQDSWPLEKTPYRAFSRDPVTISGFLDETLVLKSLQKPRRLSVRGSDGRIYCVLAKPKDDLRKDQRLMEFNTMINRFLKHDVEASKRKLYIRTYAVTPLNEECGLIEWVDNLKTFREILYKIYREKGVNPDYEKIKTYLEEACNQEKDETRRIFEEKVLSLLPSVFQEWFVESFPDPAVWFVARLRYTRSCAVMSIVGHALGLGDRHAENILFEEDTGGVLHVDFNCLFDKGLTFEKPENVPFRLTQNMVDAMGAYRWDGPFRKSCEVTLGLLRGNEDALMTILETFLHDPTTDFIGGKKKRTHPNYPDTPQGVLDNVRAKVRGMMDGESVPLSVEGYTDQMISKALDKDLLARMYVGWCAFF